MTAGPRIGDLVLVLFFCRFFLVLLQFLLVLLFREVVPANALPGWAPSASTVSHGFSPFCLGGLPRRLAPFDGIAMARLKRPFKGSTLSGGPPYLNPAHGSRFAQAEVCLRVVKRQVAAA